MNNDTMGKAFNTILGVGLAGAVVGMHAYMLMDKKARRAVQKDFKEVAEEFKTAASKMTLE